MKNLAIFASGEGTNFSAIVEAVENSKLKMSIAVLITDKECHALERAMNHHIESVYVNPRGFVNKEAYEEHIVKLLRDRSVDYIALAGYMRIVGKTLLSAYEDCIVNIHPSLLPSFRGKNAMKQAYDYGVKVMGVTVHYVNEELDGGKIIEQASIHIENETFEEVEAKLHEIEHELYPNVLKMWEE